MNISDIIFNSRVPLATKQAVIELLDANNVNYDIKVLIPTESNDDVNGSQHASDGGNDFTYDDASEDDVIEATSLGYYEYFGDNYSIRAPYTGHYYNGSETKFEAIVIDPPAYAATVQL